MNKLILKHLTPANPLVLQNDNTLVVQPVLPIPATNIDWITAANNKVDKTIQEQPHSEVVRHPKRPKTEEDAMTIMFDPRKAPQTSTTQVIGMSPVDPVGEFVVGSAVLGKPLQLLGKGIMYGAGKYLPSTKFGNWSRAKIISNTLNKSNIDSGKQHLYMLDDLYEKEFTFKPTTYYDKVKQRYVTKYPGRVAIHQDDNIFNDDYREAFLKQDMKLYPGKTGVVWWKVNKPYYHYPELHERIIKIPAAEINGTPVSTTKSIFDRVEMSGPVDITRGEAMIYNPIHGWYDRTKFTHQIKPAININLSTVDMGKMIENNKFLDLVDEFAKKYGYPLTDRSVITSTRRTNKHARKILARHNTYARGIRPTTLEPDIKYITSQIGDNFTEEQALRFMATHPHKYSPEEVSTLWFSPESNAFIYGGNSKTAAIRRMYKLSPNRNNWISDADFIVESHPMYRNLSWEHTPETDIIDIWRSPKNKGTSGPTTELVTTGNMNFTGWLNPKKFKHRMSLNTEWTPKNLILVDGKYIDIDLLP